MNYTVVWKPAAEAELARLWNAGPDRNDIAQAANNIDQLLGTAPTSVGESRYGNIRILFHPPLVVQFRVNPPDWLVEVFAVKRWGKLHQSP